MPPAMAASYRPCLRLWKRNVAWRVVCHIRLSLYHSGVLATSLSFCLSILLASSAFGVSVAIFIFMLGLSYNVIIMNMLPIFCPFF